MLCQSCKKEIEDGSNFCRLCGAKQEQKKVCPTCQIELPQDAAFCSKCGTPIPVSTPVTNNTQSIYTRADLCTSRKGFYANSSYQYTLIANKYSDYKNKLYYIDGLYDNFSLICATEKCEDPAVLTTITEHYESINVGNVNATGIYIFAYKEKHYKILWYELNGNFIKEINIPTENINLADICGKYLYYTTTNSNGETVAAYFIDLETELQTTIKKASNNCIINDIIGAYDEIYLKLTYTTTPSQPYASATGWFTYNIHTSQLTFIANSTITPQLVTKKPELFIADYESATDTKPNNRNWPLILSFDVIEQEIYLLKPNAEKYAFEIFKAPIANIGYATTTNRYIPYKANIINITNDNLKIEGARIYLDSKNLYWSQSYYELYQLQSTGTCIIYPHDNHGTANNFEVFNTTIYLEDLLASKQFVPRNCIPQKDGTMYDINNTNSV